ncbi:hypothetical protein mgb1_017 [Bacillus phage MG-B1]|uniref:Uncharacterized protein n=1 Tax=Bacillus phage MG-B1 TaxID=1309583 RepID=M4WNI6_9CAUD|nr:host nuclease inhibitor [Bacillus phage MG-B1]AGI10606.1 hypothetical protein mgb1_017 [Bacillus phage MG-B1]
MNTKGKVPATYKYIINGKMISCGSMEEISEELGVTKHALWNRSQKTRKRLREGSNVRIRHELIVDKPSIHEYVLMINDEFISCGTIKKISEETHYAYDYLLKLSNGNYIPKRKKMVLYKKC